MGDQLGLAEDSSPPQTVALAWRSLSYSVKRWSTWKMANEPLLSELNGTLSLGSLNGLLGPSGAGKTTLLNCLAGNRKATPSGPQVGASLFVNSSFGPSIDCVFIEQNIAQSIFGSLTVRQILLYAYQFKNGSTFTAEAAHQKVVSILQSLLLPEELLDRRFSLCSGGEQRRVAIAQELVGQRMPTFLFLDEPTTGLDSASAFEVVTCLQTLAHNFGLTVLASLHAPNQPTLHLFDQIIVLARGGAHSIFSGPPAQIGPFLRANLPQVDLPPEQPPIEMLIKIACNSDAFNSALITLSSQTTQTLVSTLNVALPCLTTLPDGFPSFRKSFTCTDFSTQLRRLFTFTFICQLPSLLCTLAGYLLIFLLLASTTDSKSVTPSGCVPRNSTCQPDLEATSQLTANFNYLAISLHNAAFLFLVSAATDVTPLITVFLTEYRNRWYSLGTFFWSLMLLSLGTILLFVLLLCPVIYLVSGQHLIDSSFSLTRYSHYLLCFALNALYGQAIGHFIGLLFLRFASLAIISSTVVYGLLEVFSDFFLKSDESPLPLHSLAADVVAAKYITKYLVYVFYGIDRCNTESEESWMLANHYVNPGDLTFYRWRVVQNILLVKLATLALLYFKFNDFSQFWRICQRQPTKMQLEMHQMKLKMPPIQEANKAAVFPHQVEESSKKNETLLSNDFAVKGKIILAFRHLTLYPPGSFFDISTSSSSPSRSPILRQVNGQFTFGSLNAVMGQSGAGKTSLLRVLNGQLKARLSEQTEVYLSRFATIQTAFITQDVSGHLMRGLTCRQLLVFASRLKNHREEKVEHGEIAEKILSQLDLLAAGDTPADRCSDGERKRLAVGLELTSRRMPNLLCIDEPTSGLDSNSAALVISTLRKLTRLHALTIITSIHQPTAEVLYSFDQLYVLAPGGVAVHSGPPEGVSGYLQTVFHLPGASNDAIPEGAFPIEELISLSSAGHLDCRVKELEKHTQRAIASTAGEPLRLETQLVSDGIPLNHCRFSLTCTALLIARYLVYLRAYLWKEWLAFIFITLLYGTALICLFNPQIASVSGCINPSEADLNQSCPFSKAERNADFRQLANNYSFAFLLDFILLLILANHSVLAFYVELPLFTNEQRNGWYSTGAFYLFKCLEILPILPLLLLYLALTNIYSTVLPALYWQLVGLLTLSLLAFQGMLHAIVLLIRGSLNQTILFSSGLTLILLQISNLFTPHSGLHYAYQILSNFSIVRFNWEAFMLLQYGFGRCAPGEMQPILYSMGLTDDAFWSRIVMLLGNLLFYRMVAFTLLLRKMNPTVGQKERSQQIDQHRRNLQTGSLSIAQGLFSFNGGDFKFRNV